MDSIKGAYPQVGQPRQRGALSGLGGGLLGGLIGGTIIQEVLGGLGDDGGWGDGGGDWG